MGKAEMGTAGRIALGALLGGMVGLLVLLALCALCAVLTVRGSIGQEMLGMLTTAIAFVGAAAGAAAAARYSRVRSLLTGVVSGLVFLLPLLLLTTLLCGALPFGSMTLRLPICAVTGGLFGGALCLRRKPKRGGRRKRRMA